MRMTWTNLALAAAVLYSIGTTALADSTATQSSEASAPTSFYDKLAKHATVTYFGVYRGASLNDMGNKFQPDVDGNLDTTSTQSMENLVTVGYKPNTQTTVGVSTHFFYSPVGNPLGGGKNFEWLDPALIVKRANLIQVGNFSVMGELSTTLPSSQYDYLKMHGMDASFSPIFNINYDVPNTKLSLSYYGYVTAYLPGANHTATYRNYKIYGAPNATYQFTPKLGATLWIDLIQASRANTASGSLLHGAHNADMDIEPGVAWEFVKNWTINPMINIYPKTVTMAASSVQMVIVGKAL